MKIKHTPGPWKYDFGGYGNIRPVNEDGVNICVFHRCFTERDYARQAANAKLIASAPDLLNSLRAVLEQAKRHRWHVNSDEPDVLIEAKKLLQSLEGGE